MRSLVLMDAERIRGLGFFCTFVREGSEVRWLKNCAFKFLVVDDLLVIGSVDGHAELYATFATRDLPLEQAAGVAEEVRSGQFGAQRDPLVIGAGRVGTDHKVNDWESGCYKPETPEHMRAEIEAEIARLSESGELTPP